MEEVEGGWTPVAFFGEEMLLQLFAAMDLRTIANAALVCRQVCKYNAINEKFLTKPKVETDIERSFSLVSIISISLARC